HVGPLRVRQTRSRRGPRVRELTCPSGRGADRAECHGLLIPPSTDGAGGAARPCVVMAHGLGGTVDSGLVPFAEAFAAAGFAVLACDYRGFGRSGGAPRQVVSPARQQDDYRAAIAAAAAQPEVDPERIVLWGCSLSGGLVIEVARVLADVDAVVSMCQLDAGRAAAVAAARAHRPAALLRATGTAVAAKVSAAAGRPVPVIPLTGPPGSTALL